MRSSVLIVEADERRRQSYASRFDMQGYSILLAGDAEEALSTITASRPDVVFFDPSAGMDVPGGIVQKFKEGFPYLPALISLEGRPVGKRRELSGKDGIRIDAILKGDITLEHDISAIVVGADGERTGLDDVVRGTLQQPRWRVMHEVKGLIAGLDDSPEDMRYRMQLESFLHEFHDLLIRLDAMREEGIPSTRENIAYLYRHYLLDRMPALRLRVREGMQYAVEISRGIGFSTDEKERLRFGTIFQNSGEFPAYGFYSMTEPFAKDDKRRRFVSLHPWISSVLTWAAGEHDTALHDIIVSHRDDYNRRIGHQSDIFPFYGLARVAEVMAGIKWKMQPVSDEARVLMTKKTKVHVARELCTHRGTLYHPRVVDAALEYMRTNRC